MHIKRIKIKGFKTFREFKLDLTNHLNIIVGDNETGKTTLLEAISLVLSCQVDGRSIQYGLNPYLFNYDMVQSYFEDIRKGESPSPPQILIEAYLDDDQTNELAKLRGINNSEGEDCPGLYLRVELNEDFAEDFREYVRSETSPGIIPIEYYTVVWHSFGDNPVTGRNLPFRATTIDTTLVRSHLGPNRYLSRIISDVLGDEKQRSLSMAYRKLKNTFMDEPAMQEINEHLTEKKGDITSKTLTVSMDMSTRSTWDSSITAHLDDMPFDSVGKGEQCCVQMKLAIEGAGSSHVLLIEEPENHLSHSNVSKLIRAITEKGSDRQIVVTTHSSFVLNKLGIDNVRLLSSSGDTMTLADLAPETKDYFMKLPGYETLRLILAAKTILVEGPSDELIVQKAYVQKHRRLPLEDGVDVISVRALAFKRFLEIGKLLNLEIRVVTDNDGSVDALKNKYKDYLDGNTQSIKICYDSDEACPTLEPQFLKTNSLMILSKVLGRAFADETALLEYMGNNKTDVALKVFSSDENLTFPEYVLDAIRQ